MNVVIGIDPRMASHTAMAIDQAEDELSNVKVRATRRQVDQLIGWAEPFEKRTWAIESARRDGISAQNRYHNLRQTAIFGSHSVSFLWRAGAEHVTVLD